MVRPAVLALVLAFGAAPVLGQQLQPTLTGDVRIHDPSVIEVNGQFVVFETGRQGMSRGAIGVRSSLDGIAWSDAGSIGKGVPKWASKELGYLPQNIWAPSASRHGDSWNLYYSVSSFGINTSVIGLMTNPAVNAETPGEGWVDQGLVLKSNGKDNWNAIDPWRIDLGDGRAFLAYGSFWDGIKMRELDPVTGKLIAADTPAFHLASRQGAGIEAGSILEHDGKFYLFVSFDQCCKGVASTYNIRVGRADAVTGPYLDRDGTPMLQGGGTLLLGTVERFIGPGGQEAIHTSKGDMLAYHYYDGDDRGVSKLQFSPLKWTTDGWPDLDPLP